MSCANILTLETGKIHSWLRSAGLVILSSFLIGLFAKVSIPLPFTPVPLAMQSAVILTLSVLLGRTRAAAAVLCFLAQGAAGLPVFAKGCGIAYFFGPTAGYLFGYLAAAILVGSLVERMQHRTPMKIFLALAAGTALLLTCGALYLATFVGLEQALLLGIAPFVIGDTLKLIAIAKLLGSRDDR